MRISFLRSLLNTSIVNRLSSHIGIFFFLFALQFVITAKYVLAQGTETATIAMQGHAMIILKDALYCAFWAGFFYLTYTCVYQVFIPWVSRSILGLIILLFSVAYFTEAILFSSYSMLFNNVTAGIILSSNPSEANAFLKTIFGGGGEYLLSSIIMYVLIALVAILTNVVSERYLSKYTAYKALNVLVILGSVLVGIIYTLPSQISRLRVSSYTYELSAPFERFVMGTIEHLNELEQINSSQELLFADKDQDEIISNSNLQPHTLVLIIGESLGRNYMHCYGYPLDNTPNLDRRIASGNMIAFSNVISPAPTTAKSLTATLTLHTEEDNASVKWYERPAINSVFSKAGYWSYWLSNTEKYGGAVTLPTTSISLVSDETLYLTVQSNRDFYNRKQHDYDELMLPYMKKREAIPQGSDGTRPNNLMQIIHLMGSHHTYKDRYPENFEKFKASDVPIKRSQSKDEIVAHYANSVYYNDSIINEVIKFYEKEDAIIVYFSDHSQALFEVTNYPEKYDHDLSEVGLSVPLLIYMTPSMKAKYPEMFDKVLKAKDKRIMNDLLAHSLCELMGIKTKYSDPKKEFFSEGYDDSRIRVAHGFGQSIRL